MNVSGGFSSGTYLLDPNNLEIVAGGGNVNINGASPFPTTNDTVNLVSI